MPKLVPMFKLIKFSLFVATVAVVGYVLLGISLGGKTLYLHLQGIFGTEEAQTLKNEIEKKVDDAADELKDKASNLAKERIREKLDGSDSERSPEKELSDEDRRSLDTLISKKNRQDDSADDRLGLHRLIDSKIKENR